MNKIVKVSVCEIVGPLCVSADDGQKIHDEIALHLKLGKSVVLSFDGVSTLISAFLNAAIGQLYGEFSDDQIRKLFSVEKMSRDDLVLLKRVVDNAKIYFLNRKEFDRAWKEEVPNDEE